MDRATLVSEQRDDGQVLIEKLAMNGFDIKAAAWIKMSDDGQWHLYIASDVVDEKGYAAAYQDIQAVIRGMPDFEVGPFDVRLLSSSHALVADVQKLYQRFPAPSLTQFGGSQLGKMNIEEALIYPPIKDGALKPLRKTRSKISSTKSVAKSIR